MTTPSRQPDVKMLILLGGSGNALDVLDAIRQINEASGRSIFRCVGILDDNSRLTGKELGNTRILGPVSEAASWPDAYFINAVGSPANFHRREDIVGASGIRPERFITLLHPSASISSTARIGPGSVVLQNVCIGHDARIGSHVIILPNTVISHGAAIGDFTCIAAGVCLAGDTKVGEACYLGAHTAVRGKVHIGDTCLTGMGSVILKNVPSNSVVVGNPARYLRPVLPAGPRRGGGQDGRPGVPTSSREDAPSR